MFGLVTKKEFRSFKAWSQGARADLCNDIRYLYVKIEALDKVLLEEFRDEILASNKRISKLEKKGKK